MFTCFFHLHFFFFFSFAGVSVCATGGLGRFAGTNVSSAAAVSAAAVAVISRVIYSLTLLLYTAQGFLLLFRG